MDKSMTKDIKALINYILASEGLEEDFLENPNKEHVYAIAERVNEALADYKGDL